MQIWSRGTSPRDIRVLNPEGKSRYRFLFGVVVTAFQPNSVAAQEAGPAYHPLQLDCATYRQEVRTGIRLEGGRQRSREATGRAGTLIVRANARDTLLVLEAWFDSLAVWREGGGERLEPETDGVIGGRFRGTLTPHGEFVETDRPYVPDDIAQVADVGDALSELFPPLSPISLAPGAAWRDDSGAVISRSPDGRNEGRPVERYRLIRRTSRVESRLLPDSTEVRASRRESEAGIYEWSEELGLVRWEREITVEVDVPAGGLVKQAFRTRIEQLVTIQRRDRSCEKQH